MLDRVKSQLKGDRYIWWIVVLLSLISLLAVYSSIVSVAYRNYHGNTESPFIRHAIFVAFGFILMVIVHKIDVSKYIGLSRIILIISLVLLLLTLTIGNDMGDARRSISLLSFSFQPAEFVKIILIINLAVMLAGKIHIEYQRKDIYQIIGWCAGIIFIMTFSDFANSVILAITCFTVMWIGKVPAKYLYRLVILMTLGITLALTVSYGIEKLTGKKFGRVSTVVSRITAFVNDDVDTSKNFQSNKGLVGIVKGGFFGVGPGNSSLKNSLPLAETDFIFSIIVEEYGLIGAMSIMALYLFLLGRSIVNIKHTERAFSGLLSIGLTLLIVLQAFTHISVNVGLAPNTGVTLPLISKGGSSAWATFIALGIVLSVSKQDKK